MLVKCISFIITVFGSKRYQPLLLTVAAGIITLSGIGVVTAALGSTPHDPAASTTRAVDNNTRDTLESQTPGSQSKREEDVIPSHTGNESDAPQSQPADQSDTSAPKPAEPAPSTAPKLLLKPETKRITVSPGTTYTLTAGSSDNSKLYWTAALTGTGCEGYQITPKQSTEAASFMTLTIANGQHTQPSTECLVTITAKDSSRSVDLSETISLVSQ